VNLLQVRKMNKYLLDNSFKV